MNNMFYDMFKQFMRAYEQERSKSPELNLPRIQPIEEDNSVRYVIKDLLVRDSFGKQKYGKYLHAETTEDTLQHLYEELLDAAVYIKTEINKRNKDKCENV